MKFVLFDIDETLIDSGRAGTRAMNLAFDELFSVSEAFRSVPMAGKTDPQILAEGITLHALEPSPELAGRFFERYIVHLRNSIDRKRGHVKAGIREALDRIREHDDIVPGLLTGNIEQGAMIKLEAFGLAHYFEVGAYGDDHADRNRLLPIARTKLREQKALEVAFSDCIVVGDTPRDIDCARPYGAFALAVATGHYSPETLREAGADAVFEDLSDTEKFMNLVRS